ncbi:MAG: DciA family protein [Pseudomonadota bacterium]
MTVRESTTKGFKQGGVLLAPKIRKLSESRGFAVSRVLTHWQEIVGEKLASCTRPVKVSYGRQGLGATLTVLTTGAKAPEVDMQKEALRERVNAAYGFNAISRVTITQTAATGFADGQVSFTHRQTKKPAPAPSAKTRVAAAQAAEHVEDQGLRTALEQLGRNVLNKSQD